MFSSDGSLAVGLGIILPSHSPRWSCYSPQPCLPLSPRSSTSCRSSTLYSCSWSWSDSPPSCTVPRSWSSASRYSWSPRSTGSSSMPLGAFLPSPSHLSAPPVFPAAVSHSPGWSCYSLPPCSPLSPRSSTSSRSSIPCPYSWSWSGSPPSRTDLHSWSSASRYSWSPRSTRSSSMPPAHSPPSPSHSSALLEAEIQAERNSLPKAHQNC